MRNSFVGFSLAAAVLASLTSLPALSAGQTLEPEGRQVCQAIDGRCNMIVPPNVPFGDEAGDFEIPRTRGGKPDFSGVYAGPGFTHQVGPNDTEDPGPAGFFIRPYDATKMSSLTPLGEAEFYRPFSGDLKIDDPIALCLPYGFSGQILVPYAQQWVHSDDYLVIKHEFMNNFSRIIPLDGRPHPENVELTWGGHSVGHWEGDTLVIDTVGLKEWWLGNPHPRGSLWHSDALHVIERLRWIGPRVVSYDVTIDDPLYFTQPWSEAFHMVLHPTWELLEFVCNENDRCRAGNCEAADVQQTQR